MKVLQVSGTDRIGGAGIAAYRLHQSLQQIDIDSQMLVMRKTTSDPSVHRISAYLNRWGRLQRRYAQNRHAQNLKQNPQKPESAYWSLNNQPYPIADAINAFDADIVHLHWIGDNYLPTQQLSKITAPIVWTLHDMWAFTGGCHYSADCQQYQHACGNCPQLSNTQSDDISNQILQQKKQSWLDMPMTMISPSQWLADCVRSSSVLRSKSIQVIPNGIDCQQFKPIDSATARHALNLPQDKKLVLFGAFGGADDPRKGFTYLRDTLQLLPDDADIELVFFGSDNPQNLDVNLPVNQVGRLADSVSIALLYSACDVFVAPSTQDNLPNTILESLACGTPCVAFDTGGIPDMIQHKNNGYLARLRDNNDLAKGIQWTLKQDISPTAIHQQIAEQYALTHIAGQYGELYQSLIT